MSWYVIDAVDRAIERTRTCLIEPFNFWKWLKLAIIVFFIGGVGSGGFNNVGGNEIPQDFIDSAGNFGNNLASSSIDSFAILAIVFIILLALLMSLIGSVMEFVFVKSLVSNDVRIREYFMGYLTKGLSLFILRIIVGFGVLLFLAILALPLIYMAGVMNGGIGSLGGASIALLIMGIFAFILAFAIIVGSIDSLINLAIPVSMYSESGIFSALSRVLGQFRSDWQQILVYWIGRLILTIIVGFLVLIAVLIVILALGILYLIVDLILYFALSAILAETTVWILLAPILVVEFIVFLFVIAFVGMPANVFMKYHMLTFLQKWYPMEIPMFDKIQIMGADNTDEWVNETIITED